MYSFLPDKIEVEVRPYDASHETLLRGYTVWSELERLINGGLAVPKQQFLVYSLFRNRDTTTLDRLHDLACLKEGLFSMAFDATSQSFRPKTSLVRAEHRPEAQEVGEALGLCLMDAVLGTNEQDWARISESGTKTLDYVASTGAGTFELEAKGSFVADASEKSSSVSHSRADIEKKKAASARKAHRFGTIAALDTASTKPRLWVLDPPPERDENPKRVRLLNRMAFLQQWISLISPRSSLAVALSTRLLDLQHMRSPEELNGVPLGGGSEGSPLSIPTDPGAIHSRFFLTRSVVADGPAGGVIVPCGEGEIFFAGIRQDLVDLAVGQEFDAIASYEAPRATLTKGVIGVLSAGRFRAYGFNEDAASVAPRGRGYFAVQLRGELHYSRGGLVFGWLPRPQGL